MFLLASHHCHKDRADCCPSVALRLTGSRKQFKLRLWTNQSFMYLIFFSMFQGSVQSNQSPCVSGGITGGIEVSETWGNNRNTLVYSGGLLRCVTDSQSFARTGKTSSPTCGSQSNAANERWKRGGKIKVLSGASVNSWLMPFCDSAKHIIITLAESSCFCDRWIERWVCAGWGGVGGVGGLGVEGRPGCTPAL